MKSSNLFRVYISCSFNGSKKDLMTFVQTLKQNAKVSDCVYEYTQDKSSFSDKKMSLSAFKQKYSPTVSKYTSRSLLVKTKNKVDDNDKVFESSELSKPLFYNPSLKAWVTSVDNSKFFTQSTSSGKTPFISLGGGDKNQSNKNSLNKYLDKYKLKVIPDEDSCYDNTSSRVLFLESENNSVPSKSDMVFKDSQLKHGLFFMNSLKLWQTSVANENILSKCVGYLYSTNDDKSDSDSSYNDELSEMGSNDYENTLSHLSFEEYGKGLLIRPKKTDSKYGQKYFHGGYWNKSLQGWVFSKSKQENLESLGVSYGH